MSYNIIIIITIIIIGDREFFQTTATEKLTGVAVTPRPSSRAVALSRDRVTVAIAMNAVASLYKNNAVNNKMQSETADFAPGTAT